MLTPGELRTLLARVREPFLPWAVLGAFAGLRAEEISLLRWEEIHLDENLIEITEAVAKSTSRIHGDARFVDIAPNLRAWLEAWRGATGPVCPSRPGLETARLRPYLPGGVWPRNGLRHSYVSYSAALTGNLPAVADQAGNSTQVARRNYRRPMIRRAAQEWFAIMPEGERPGNVVPLASAAAARLLV